MKIACICCTFNRPHLLADSIECFNRQTYPLQKRELIILDDAGQYEEQAGPGWWLLSVGKRFRTLGEKRNASAALVSADVDALAVWDDDDVYLPWHLEQAAEVLQAGADWSRPDRLWVDHPKQFKPKMARGLFHAAWIFTRDAFIRAGGYPAMQSGQDQKLGGRLRRAGAAFASPTPAGRASFVLRWGTVKTPHLSAMSRNNGYERRANEEIIRQTEPIRPAWSQDWVKKAEEAEEAVQC